MNVQLIILLVFVGLISNSTGDDDIAKRLEKRYKNVKGKCSHRGKEKPAYQCSGILIRGVGSGVQHAWEMKSLNQQKDSFSLSFLRHDQKLTALYGTGFIVYPHLKTPKKKNTYKVYCAFPFNAATDSRTGHGCGKFTNNDKSNHCDRLHIKTFKAWVATKNTNCAFDMTKKSAAKYFDICLKAKRYIEQQSPQNGYSHNELKMHAWNAKPKKIPIEAFWFSAGSASGKLIAEKFQDDFYAHGGGTVPIVEIRFPTKTAKFKVKYYKRKPHK